MFLIPIFLFPNISDCGRYDNLCRSLTVFSLPLAVIFPLALLTFFLRDQVFQLWLKFTIIVVPIILFFIYQSEPIAMGGFLASAMTVTRAEVSLQLSVIYLALSLLLIAYKYFTLRRTKKN